MNYEWKRADPNDEHRCNGPSKLYDGRCPFMAVQNPTTGEWTEFCPRHGANKQIAKQDKESENLYSLAKHQQRLLRFEKHSKSKSLTAELAILRMLLETKLQRFGQTDDELMIASGSISEMILKINTLVKTITNIELRSGLLMDREQVERLANTFISIVGDYVSAEHMEELMFRLDEALQDAAKPTESISGSPAERT